MNNSWTDPRICSFLVSLQCTKQNCCVELQNEMLMANCLINLFGLFYCHSLRSSSRCKMADWCVCLFIDMPLRLVSSALSSPPSSDVSVPLSAQNMFISDSSAYYMPMQIWCTTCSYLSLYRVPVRPWIHMSYTEETSHPGPVFHFDSIWFLSSFSWFVCICAYRNAVYRQSSECVCGDGLCCNFFLSLWDRCLWSFLPWVHLPSSASTRGEVQQPFWPYYAYARSHSCTSAHIHVAHLLLLFPSSQERALAHEWLSQACFLDRERE